MLAIFSLIFLTQLFFGERSNLVGLATMTAMVGILRMGRRLKLVWFVSAILGLLVFIFMLSALREPDFSLNRAATSFMLNVFYGNSFSDVRDFAVVLSFWDGHYFYGLTYLAGLLAFIPRFISPFRDTWAIGVVTAGMAGFKPTEHPGLRVGPFGEAFLNFGWVGVALIGLLVGAVLRMMDLRMKQALALLPERSVVVFSYFFPLMFITMFQNSSNASAVYTVLLIFALSWILATVARLLKIRIA